MNGRVRKPHRWPASYWYAAGAAYVLAFTLLFSGIYYAINGAFWAPFWWGLGGGLPVVLARLWWYRRQREKGRAT